MKSKVVIEIRGGTLVGVYANDPEIELCVLDWDDVEAADVRKSLVVKAHRLEDMP